MNFFETISIWTNPMTMWLCPSPFYPEPPMCKMLLFTMLFVPVYYFITLIHCHPIQFLLTYSEMIGDLQGEALHRWLFGGSYEVFSNQSIYFHMRSFPINQYICLAEHCFQKSRWCLGCKILLGNCWQVRIHVLVLFPPFKGALFIWTHLLKVLLQFVPQTHYQ